MRKIHAMKEHSVYNKSHPFLSSIKERYSLCKGGSEKHTHHVVLDLSGSGITYQVGDSIAVFSTYDPDLVERTLKALRLTGEERVKDKHADIYYPLREFLTAKANITEVSKRFVAELAKRQFNPQKKEHLLYLLEDQNKDALKEFMKNREVWDLMLEHEEVSFEAEEIASLLMPMLPRFYSIASSMKAVGEEVHLTVSYVKYNSNGQQRLGVCSHYLCDLAPLRQAVVPIYIQPHHGFTLPENSDADLIMVGPGTGVAPYRGFMQERIAQGAKGRHWLFFGEWNRDTNYFYEDFWEHLKAEGKLKIDLAFSRDQPHKVYVQHRMLEKANELFNMLENGAYFFVCGDAHRMAKDVDAALHRIVQEQGGCDEAAAKEYVKNLRHQKRYLKDVY